MTCLAGRMALPGCATLVAVLSCAAPEAAVDAAAITAAVPSPPIEYPLSIGPNGRRLMDRSGRAVFLHGEAAWGLATQLDTLETERYLEDRRQKGFNAIYVRLIEHRYSVHVPPWSNRAGDAPFDGRLSTGEFDLTSPNEAYWHHVDRMLAIAHGKGFLVIGFPAYLGHASDTSGWLHELKANGLARIHAYGEWLGQRYASQPNLIWGLGGDRTTVGTGGDLAPHVNALASGIRTRDSTHLMTAHSARNRSSVDDYDQPWLDLNATYAAYVAEDGPSIATRVRLDYQRRPRKPFVLLEGHYENEHGVTAHGARAQAYWAVLGGATGHFYGNWPIWAFGAVEYYGDDRRLSWERALRLEGAQDMVHLGDLFRSRPFALLEPDDDACAPADAPAAVDDPAYIACARTSDGSTLLAYLPTPRALAVNLGRLADTMVTAWWFDPRTGAADQIGVFPAAGTRTFDPPGPGDWVLVVDARERNFPPPGAPQR